MRDDEAALAAGGQGEGFTEAERLVLQEKLLAFLARQTALYTAGESSAVPMELAEELLESVCFTLGVSAEADPTLLRGLLGGDIKPAYRQGVADLEAKAKYARSLWQAACLTLPGIENQSLLDTMKSIGGFFKKYDCRFFAHQIPCDIDYQLCRPAPDSLMGVDYVIEYLRRICVENDLLRRFDPALTVRLLDLYCPDYKGLLINLYEPVAANALGLALTGGDIRKLEVSEGERERLAALFEPIGPSRAEERLRDAAERVCGFLEIREEAARDYMQSMAADLYPRIRAALPHGNLAGVFLGPFA